MQANKRRQALHVLPAPGGKGGRPCGEADQHPDRPVNWQRLAQTQVKGLLFRCGHLSERVLSSAG